MRNCPKRRALRYLMAHAKRPEPEPRPVKPHVEHHIPCPECGQRLVRSGAPRCWLCEPKDAEFAELDRLISQGVETPRARL